MTASDRTFGGCPTNPRDNCGKHTEYDEQAGEDSLYCSRTCRLHDVDGDRGGLQGQRRADPGEEGSLVGEAEPIIKLLAF